MTDFIPENAIEALAHAIASANRMRPEFEREKGAAIPRAGRWKAVGYTGTYIGYMERAEEMMRLIKSHNYAVTPIGLVDMAAHAVAAGAP